MNKQRWHAEAELAGLAKQFREQSGRTKAALARELGVGRATIQLAEEYPEQSLSKLRSRIIEACSPFKVRGPVYLLERK